jgi:hypothetical protein
MSCALTVLALRVAGPYIRQGVILTLDIMNIPYYGKLTTDCITGGKAEPETAYFTQFFTLSSVVCGFRLPVALLPVQKGDLRMAIGYVGTGIVAPSWEPVPSILTCVGSRVRFSKSRQVSALQQRPVSLHYLSIRLAIHT